MFVFNNVNNIKTKAMNYELILELNGYKRNILR